MKEKTKIISSIKEFPNRLSLSIVDLQVEILLKKHRDTEAGWAKREEWTLAQIVHHIADAHMNKLFQLRHLLTEDNPKLVEYKGEKEFPNFADGKSPNIESSLQILKGVHVRVVELLESLSDEDWKRKGIHPSKGSATLQDIARSFVRHGNDHLKKIKEKIS